MAGGVGDQAPGDQALCFLGRGNRETVAAVAGKTTGDRLLQSGDGRAPFDLTESRRLQGGRRRRAEMRFGE